MDRKIFAIEMKSLRTCIEHLRTLDLAGMEVLAGRHGSAADVQLISSVRTCLLSLPAA
jgi:hypothetical protein